MTEQRRTALDVIRVNTPCPVAWESMTGNEGARFCEGCGRHVHNLSAMTADEAERLVCASAGLLCVRFTRAPDGAVQTVDYRPQPHLRQVPEMLPKGGERVTAPPPPKA